MKLWLQACGALGADPAWDDYEHCVSKHLRKVAREDTEIDLHGTQIFGPGVVAHQYDAYLHTSQIIEAAIRAEKEGYDAFVQMGMLDLGYFEVKEAVEIPVVFPIEASLHIATLMAPRVAFMAMNRGYLDRLNSWAAAYGFQGRLTPGGWVDLSPGELQSAFRNPQPTLDKLVTAARRIGEQGANMLLCAGNPITMLLVDQGRTEINGVRILDSLGILVKVAEMLVDLQKMGVSRHNMGIFAPVSKDEIRSTRKLYGVEK